jgi:pimeloyl-ACP methyl ester carboxylesterase
MARPNRKHLADFRGASRMAFDATAGIVDVVERMHSTIQRSPAPLGRPVERGTRGITGFVYQTVRGSVRLLGRGLDASLAPFEGLLPAADEDVDDASPRRLALQSILNGVYGDYLVRTDNPLAIEMSLRHDGRALDVTRPADALAAARPHEPTGKLLVLVHGLCLNDLQWNHEGHDHGAALADELGYTPLYVRYNSGLHVADNGQRLAELLETLVAHWPRPVQELTLLGHSMGGLVARSACREAGKRSHSWPAHLRHLVFLGTPHHGAPLERGGHRLDYLMALSPYSVPFTRLGRMRSAGIQDLRHGTITSDAEHEFVPLPANVQCFAAAAALGPRRNLVADRLVGDGLVPLDSALGKHRTRSLRLPKDHQWIGYEMGHLELLHRPEVYAQLRAWLQQRDT